MESAQSDDAGIDQRGFGIIEIVVAMFLLGIVAVMILPSVITSLQLSSANVRVTTASQLVNEQLDLARGIAPTCDAIQTFSAETLGMLQTDPRGTVLRVHREAATTCPTTYPDAMTFTAWVSVDGSTDRLAQASTRIFVTSQSGATP